MNDRQRQGGGIHTVEADVIFHHPVCSDLSSPAGEDGGVCPLPRTHHGNANSPDLGFELDDQGFCRQSPPVTKEYLLDGGTVIGNHHFDRQQGDGSYISNTDQFNITDLSHQPDTYQIPKLDAGRDHNCTHGRNGIGGDMNGARANVPDCVGPSLYFKGEAREEAEGCPSLCREGIVKSLCHITNVTASAEQGTAAPGTHCIAAGNQPPIQELLSHSPSADYTLYEEPGLEASAGHRDGSADGRVKLTAPKEEPDIVIEVCGEKVSAHKSVLAGKSDYFKARQSRDILKVKGLKYKTLTILIDYIYTSRMNVHKDNVVEVITGAKILQIPCAVQAAMDAVSEQVTVENCYEILSIAKKQRLNELKETAYRFMSDNFLQILREPAVYGRLTGSERDLVLRKRMEGKMSLMVAEINDVFDRVGSQPQSRCNSRPQSPLSVASFEENHMIYYFNEAANDWRPLTVMPDDINTKGCGVCTMYNYLFVAGGIKGYGDKGKVSDRVFCYNPVNNRWSEVRPLNQARSQLKLVSMEGNLYAIGGECLFTVEKYDPRTDRWTPVAQLPKGAFAVAHEATTCNGELYVSGGSLFYRLLRYDAKRDEWQECPYNNSRKKSSDMVALKSFIYRFDVSRDQGVTVFKYNTIVKMWHDCASQREGSPLPFRCAVMGNRIYCVNKTQTLQFVVEDDASYFVEEPLRPPLEAKGILFPFVLRLPEKTERFM
ncbi:kelch repeat and BTB domain-containing protein 11 [Esox lucius]|uniref:BTB domain-containing protein n=1 Tax=Esox lucius TaxID=8010 RepID=A0AAY5KQB7_ESOLU|nr:kelch repeat and BTB domain-containing protein 11 [Esox lucius]XP_010877470.3 kelch repeat and BTB domain-containing protein 11 [Esox lucius]XP_010877471.3 kelch repeat and BTB domain-containing protein 11 [Esox lucius]XP_034153398.1 kelch repeat and BTB domain-containing protein 11 [Esox lucius]